MDGCKVVIHSLIQQRRPDEKIFTPTDERGFFPHTLHPTPSFQSVIPAPLTVAFCLQKLLTDSQPDQEIIRPQNPVKIRVPSLRI